jgi:hypothetical protein
MEDVLTRIWTDLAGRLSGPLTLRLFLQPMMATLFAARDGVADARQDRPPYRWSIFTHPGERRRLIGDGWRAIAKIILMAIVLDLVYQLIVFRRIYPVEAIDVAIILAIIPHCLLRGPVNRIAHLRVRR